MKLKMQVLAAAAGLALSAGAMAQTAVGGFTNMGGLYQSSYSFTLSGPSNVTGDVDLFGGTAAVGVNLLFGSTSLSDLDASDTFSFSNLAGGSYTLLFTGFSSGAGAFGGFYNVSAVPEPETYAMMLAGLGVMGFMAARRRRQG